MAEDVYFGREGPHGIERINRLKEHLERTAAARDYYRKNMNITVDESEDKVISDLLYTLKNDFLKKQNIMIDKDIFEDFLKCDVNHPNFSYNGNQLLKTITDKIKAIASKNLQSPILASAGKDATQGTFSERLDITKDALAKTPSIEPKKEENPQRQETPPSSPMIRAFYYSREILAELGQGKKMADIVELKGDKANFNTYLENTAKFQENVTKQYPGLETQYEETSGTLKASINTKNGNKGELIRSFDKSENCPKITVSNPPSDEAIILLLDISSDMKDLKMDKPCNDVDTALRLYEASILASNPLKLHADDIKMLENNERYSALTNMLLEDKKELLASFKDAYHNNQKTWKLGVSDLPKEDRLTFRSK